MSTFDVYFFLLAWASGVILAFTTMLGPVRKRLSKSGMEDRR